MTVYHLLISLTSNMHVISYFQFSVSLARKLTLLQMIVVVSLFLY